MVETSLFAAKSPFRPTSPQLKLTQIIANYGAVGAHFLCFLPQYKSYLSVEVVSFRQRIPGSPKPGSPTVSYEVDLPMSWISSSPL